MLLIRTLWSCLQNNSNAPIECCNVHIVFALPTMKCSLFSFSFFTVTLIQLLLSHCIVLKSSTCYTIHIYALSTALGTFKQCSFTACTRLCRSPYLTGHDSQHDQQEHGTEEMHPSRNDRVPADTSSRSSPPVLVPYWGGFFRHRGMPLMLCRRCATNLITRTHRQPSLAR